MGVWTLTITQTTTYGIDPVWDGVIITVGCIITDITADAAPSEPSTNLTYNLYAAPLLIDLNSWAYTQTPPCAYTWISVFTWTIPAAGQTYIQQVPAKPQPILSIQSSLKAAVGTYALVHTNLITDSNNRVTPATFTKPISFNVRIIDPCDTSTITPLTLAARTIVNGGSYTWTFTEAAIEIETANEGKMLCGARTYKVYMPGGTTTEVTGDWMTIT